MTDRLVVSVPTSVLAQELTGAADVDIVVWPMNTPPPRRDLNVVVLGHEPLHTALPLLRGLPVVRLVQSLAIGYDDVATYLPPGVPFANGAGIHESSTAELAVALTLAAQREIPSFVRSAEHRTWSPRTTPSLLGQRVTLMGFGGIGRSIARRLAGFEVRIEAVATRARVQDGVHVHHVTDLHELLPRTDVLISTLPSSPETQHLIDDPALSALPDRALVVNVGRGPVIDTHALTDHIRRGRIRAALDVTDPEPLPSDHALWTLEGVLISPHVGGATTGMVRRAGAVLRSQITRLQSGSAPTNIVLGG